MTYLGYRIDSKGLHLTNEKIRTVQSVPEPRNVTELKSYLGLLMYYGRFLPHLPSTLAPLYALLHQDTEWRWDQKEQESFQQSKTYYCLPKYLYTLIPTYQLSYCSLQHLKLWYWSGISSQDARQYRKTHWFCFLDIICSGTTVLTNQEGRVVMCIWHVKILC